MTSGGVRTDDPVSGSAVGNDSLATLLARWARERGDEVAITYLDYAVSVDGVATSLTWSEFDTRVSAVAALVQARTAEGDRVVILARQSAEYVVGLLAAMRAGRIAVPLFQPDLPGHADRLAAVLADCAPTLALTLDDQRATLDAYLAEKGVSVAHIASIDTVPDSLAAEYEPVVPDPDTISYLQYTSGSTRIPAGVVITNRNVVTNARQNAECYLTGEDPDAHTLVSWLPLFHDMGLVLAVAVPVFAGLPVVLMDPIAFLVKPARWVTALANAEGGVTAAPNFAYAYAASRVTDREKAFLDMSDVVSLVDGSEPITMASVNRFADAFAECGLPRTAHRPSMGMAEAVVLISAAPPHQPPKSVTFDREALTRGAAVVATGETASTTELVSCGRAFDQELRIVDPEAGKLLDEGTVGELWLSGVNIAQGYWNRPEQTAESFGQDLEDDGFDGRGADGRGWFRTGDLGVLHEGDLYITGRMKDLIIVDGRNHYPQDIEATVEQAHVAVRKHSLVAFSVFDGESEKVMVMLERSKVVEAADLDRAEVTKVVKAAVSTHLGLSLHDVLIVEPGGVPRTSSGKVSRAVCRKMWAEGTLKDGRPE